MFCIIDLFMWYLPCNIWWNSWIAHIKFGNFTRLDDIEWQTRVIFSLKYSINILIIMLIVNIDKLYYVYQGKKWILKFTIICILYLWRYEVLQYILYTFMIKSSTFKSPNFIFWTWLIGGILGTPTSLKINHTYLATSRL